MRNGRGHGSGGGGNRCGMGKGMGRDRGGGDSGGGDSGGGRGQGMGRGRGRGRGMGRCREMASTAGAPADAVEPREDAQQAHALKARAQEMADQLGAITNRIAELEAAGAKTSAPPAHAAATVPQAQKRLARMTAIIDKEKCTCCGLCVDICPDQAISINDAATVDSSRCTSCGSCVNECPNEAITMSNATQPTAL